MPTQSSWQASCSAPSFHTEEAVALHFQNNEYHAPLPYRLSAAPFPGSATSPQHVQRPPSGPRVMSGYITTEEHERVMRRNSQLTLELQSAKQELTKAKEDIARAEQGIRELAAWSYYQLQKRKEELAEARSAQMSCEVYATGDNERKHNQDVQALNAAWLSLVETMTASQEEARRGGGQTQEGKENEMVDYFDEDEDDSPPGAESFPSITDQVEELIAEEKDRLSMAIWRGAKRCNHQRSLG